ncbi:MAG: hypothetical protein JWN04_3104 [Myxococcaceae bacterium]|nr:hypothetical protein [Myxococcaceae bacterium]
MNEHTTEAQVSRLARMTRVSEPQQDIQLDRVPIVRSFFLQRIPLVRRSDETTDTLVRINDERALMRKDADDRSAPPDRAFTAAFALLATALACSIVVLAAPRPVVPARLPPLRLSATALEAQRALDRTLVASARSFMHDPQVAQLYELYREEGLVELEPAVDLEILRAERRERTELARRVFARLGAQASRAFTAHVLDDAMRALTQDRNSDEARGLLGTFPDLLTRYGYADAAGRLRAPELSVRGLYKARFNMIFDRPLLSDFSNIELQAYEGFNALEAGGLPPERRAEAAGAFQRAGGTDGAEALATWLFNADRRPDALALFAREYQRTSALRLRNMMLVAREPQGF